MEQLGQIWLWRAGDLESRFAQEAVARAPLEALRARYVALWRQSLRRDSAEVQGILQPDRSGGKTRRYGRYSDGESAHRHHSGHLSGYTHQVRLSLPRVEAQLRGGSP